MKANLKYRRIDKYKYEVIEDTYFQTKIKPEQKIIGADSFAELNTDGILTAKFGYCYDGASGPTWDTENSMRASLVHDVLYQFMREGLIDYKKWVDYADELFYKILLEDGMNKVRAWYYFHGVNNPIAHLCAKPKG